MQTILGLTVGINEIGFAYLQYNPQVDPEKAYTLLGGGTRLLGGSTEDCIAFKAGKPLPSLHQRRWRRTLQVRQQRKKYRHYRLLNWLEQRGIQPQSGEDSFSRDTLWSLRARAIHEPISEDVQRSFSDSATGCGLGGHWDVANSNGPPVDRWDATAATTLWAIVLHARSVVR